MTLSHALRRAGQAARANLLPGLLLQVLLLIFLGLYLAHEGTRDVLFQVADLKKEVGYLFAFVSYVLSAAILPELLRIGIFQKGRPTHQNLTNFLTSAPAWGAMGILVDSFYRLQALWFGTGNDIGTVLTKVVVDQFIFSPFVGNALMIGYFAWRDSGFRRSALRKIFNRDFFPERIFPVQVAGWCIWIPGVSLVYFMPSELQIPVASLIQAFWVLVFTMLNRARLTAERSSR